MKAILVATGYDCYKALFGLGNYYVGGNKYTQDLSTSMYNASSIVALSRLLKNAFQKCPKQNVPLPCHCHKLIEWEGQCI